jgi:hypothetical protein
MRVNGARRDAWASGRAAAVKPQSLAKEELSLMHAVLRINTYDPAKLAEHPDQLAEFDRIHAARAGYLGTVEVDLGQGRRFVLNLWDTDENRQAALAALGPAVERLVNPLFSAPSELIGVGEVISTDLHPGGRQGS